jgi:uncharacterized protein (DUF58 family)
VDASLISRLSDLELIARVTVEGALSGLHRSPFHGCSAEFSQYRRYQPGDDLKYVDWKLLARTDRLYTRQFRETTNLAALIVLDASGSMAFGDEDLPTKFRYAGAAAAALAHLVSRQGDAAGLLAFRDDVHAYVPARTGPGHLRRLLATIARIRPEGPSSPATALRRALDRLGRRGLLVMLSDFYDGEDETAAQLRRAARLGHEVALFQVVSRAEVEFPYAGDLSFEDLESGAIAPVAARQTRRAYREAFADFLARWRTRAAGQGMDYTLLMTDRPLDVALRRWLLSRP